MSYVTSKLRKRFEGRVSITLVGEVLDVFGHPFVCRHGGSEVRFIHMPLASQSLHSYYHAVYVVCGERNRCEVRARRSMIALDLYLNEELAGQALLRA